MQQPVAMLRHGHAFQDMPVGVLSMRNLVLGVGLVGMIGAGMIAAPTVRAQASGPGIPFDAAIAASHLVVVATTELRTDGAIVVHVERVLAGAAPAVPAIVFPAPADPPALVDGGRAVIAFSAPTTIDAAAPTRAWQISADGYVDPQGLQPADGLPPTLAALYTWFGQPMRDTPAATAGSGLPNLLGPTVLVLLALAMAQGGISRRERRVPVVRGRPFLRSALGD
jgi:hypothetical protein